LRKAEDIQEKSKVFGVGYVEGIAGKNDHNKHRKDMISLFIVPDLTKNKRKVVMEICNF
jgi:hypothetical protein